MATKWRSNGQKTYAYIWNNLYFREFLAHNWAKSFIFQLDQVYLITTIKLYYYLQVLAKMWILYTKNLKNFTKSAITPFLLFFQSRSLKNNHALHFSIFLLEILNTASQLNFAANVWARFLNCVKMAPRSKFKNPARMLAVKFSWEAVFKISSESIEKCRVWLFFSDRDWKKTETEI